MLGFHAAGLPKPSPARSSDHSLIPLQMQKPQYNGPAGDFIDRVVNALIDYSGDGLILLCPERRILSCNRAAQKVLANGTQLRIASGRLTTAQQDDELRLQQAIALVEGDVVPHNSIALGDPIAGGVLRVVVVPLTEAYGSGQQIGRARIALLLQHGSWPIQVPGELLRDAFDLTERESMLAIHLAEGGDVNAFAERNGLSMNTVRPCLKMVFEKTGTRCQPELVRLLASLAL